MIAPAIEHRRLRVAGLERRILVAGPETAPPLVLLHGIAGSADEWQGVMPGLAERYRVYAPDAPGHGHSAKPRAHDGHRYDVAFYTAATLDLLGALGVDRAPLLALSGGGPVALTLALDHPDRVTHLVLVDAAGLGREVSWNYRLATLPFARTLFRRGLTPTSIEAAGRRLLHNRDRLPDGWAERRLAIWSTDGAVEAFFATVRHNLTLRGQRHTFTHRLPDVVQPTLIVWGRQDPIIPLAHALSAARLIPNARLHLFDPCGHIPPWEYPDEFVRLLLDFLPDRVVRRQAVQDALRL